MNEKKGILCVFTSALLMSIGGLCIKEIPWPSLAINAFRSIISVCILLTFAGLTHRKLQLTPGVGLGAFSICGATVLYTVANKLTTAGNAVLLQFTAPIFVILFMWLLFHERPGKLDVVACFCVFGGVLCFLMDSLSTGRLLGDTIALVSGVCYAGVFLMNRFPGGDPLWATILGQSLGALIGLPALLGNTQFDRRSLTFGLLLGVFQLGLAYLLLTTGIRVCKPITASLITGIEPVLNPVLVALMVGETLTPLSLAGGCIVFLSVMAYNLLTIRAENSPSAG